MRYFFWSASRRMRCCTPLSVWHRRCTAPVWGGWSTPPCAACSVLAMRRTSVPFMWERNLFPSLPMPKLKTQGEKRSPKRSPCRPVFMVCRRPLPYVWPTRRKAARKGWRRFSSVQRNGRGTAGASMLRRHREKKCGRPCWASRCETLRRRGAVPRKGARTPSAVWASGGSRLRRAASRSSCMAVPCGNGRVKACFPHRLPVHRPYWKSSACRTG